MDELGFCVDSYGMLSVEMIELRESIMSLMKLISFMIEWGNFPSKKVHRLDQILEKKGSNRFQKKRKFPKLVGENERGGKQKRETSCVLLMVLPPETFNSVGLIACSERKKMGILHV